MKKIIFLTVFVLLTLVGCNKNLQWSNKASDINWYDAENYCKNLNEGGYDDWRLPNIDELRTLIQNHPGTQTGGSCPISDKAGKLAYRDLNDDCLEKNGNNFSKLGDTDWFWSSSFQSDGSNRVWCIDFGYGGVGTVTISKFLIYDVRCVR